MKNIGFFTEQSAGAGGFHDAVWNSVINASKEFNTNLYVFCGGYVNDVSNNPDELNKNLIYRLANNQYLDGLIINCIIGNYINYDKFIDFCKKYLSIPIISIIGPIKGFPDVHVNNKIGMEKIILHLIQHHGFKKLAFIKGVDGNPDAEERLDVYKKTLKANNLVYDPSLIFKGNFQEESGYEAIDYFYKQNNKEIEAIIASNDSMAFGAINALRKIGKKVPIDVAVVGFDNANNASVFNPSLTTVNQPFDKIGNKSMELLLEMIKGKINHESIEINSELIIRQSCGCFSKNILNAKFDDNIILNKDNNTDKIDLNKIPDEFINNILDETKIDYIDNERLKQIIILFFDYIANIKENKFLNEFQNILIKTVLENNDVSTWHNFINILKKNIYQSCQDNNIIFKAENLINQSHILISEMSAQSQGYKAIIKENNSELLRDVGSELITTFNFNDLKDVIKNQLNKLGIHSCFISLLKDSIDQEKELESSFFLAYKKDKQIGDLSEIKTLSLPPKNILTDLKRCSYNIHTLNFNNKILGYAMFEIGPEDGIIYDSLEIQISSSLMGSQLLHKSEITEMTLKHRSDKIEQLIKPMLNSINETTNKIADKLDFINNLINITKENSEKLTSTNNSIKQMGVEIYKMFDIINIIEDVSARVNLLALNTSIEAAHAGQYGKGFSIISGEIRKLADSIKNNTKNISGILNEIRLYLDNTNTAGNESLVSFKKLESDVIEVAGTLKQIADFMDELSKNSSEIMIIMDIK